MCLSTLKKCWARRLREERIKKISLLAGILSSFLKKTESIIKLKDCNNNYSRSTNSTVARTSCQGSLFFQCQSSRRFNLNSCKHNRSLKLSSSSSLRTRKNTNSNNVNHNRNSISYSLKRNANSSAISTKNSS